MAEKYLRNCLQTLGVTGLSQATSNVLAATGNSQELYEFAAADAARFYLDISAVGGAGSIKFALMERDPATGLMFKNNPAADPLFNDTGFTAVTAAPVVSTIDPVYFEACQVAWTIAGFTSVTCSLVALLARLRAGS